MDMQREQRISRETLEHWLEQADKLPADAKFDQPSAQYVAEAKELLGTDEQSWTRIAYVAHELQQLDEQEGQA